MNLDAIIVGGGISGLVAAFKLNRFGRKIALLESTSRVGGVIETINTGKAANSSGYLVERGPNSLRGTHAFLSLVDELGLRAELQTAEPTSPAYVFCRDRLHPVPMNPMAALRASLLSTQAKIRILAEPFIKPRQENDEESIASFVRRRLGAEVLDHLVAPFISGIYAGNVEQLSIDATFRRLAQMERESGSISRGLVRSLRAKRSEPAAAQQTSLRPYRLCSFNGGMETLTRSLAASLKGRLFTNATIEDIRREQLEDSGSFQLQVTVDGAPTTLTTSNLIIATPAFASAKIVESFAPQLSPLLNVISYNSLVAVPLGFQKECIGVALNGFGFLTAPSSGLRVLGSIWNSSLFPSRAPSGFAVMTSFIGGTNDPEAADIPDEELTDIVERDLRRVLRITGSAHRLPITKYKRAIPQYELGHLKRVESIEKEQQRNPGLWLLGNYLRGVSLGDCIEHSLGAADEVERRIAARHT